MLLRLEAIRCWSGPDLTVKIKEEGCGEASSFSVRRTVRIVKRLGVFMLTS